MKRLSTFVILVGLCMLGYVGLTMTEAHALNSSFDERTAPRVEAAATHHVVIADGTPLGRLRIPRLALDIVVTQGDGDKALRRGAGHLADSPWLGQPGNMAIAGHRDTVFEALDGIHAGDMINIAGADRSAWYEVTETMIVDPSDVSVLKPSAKNVLTLITCYPFGYIGPAPSRFVVRAAEVR